MPGLTSASTPGINVSPRMLTANRLISTINGARIRRRTRKMAVDEGPTGAILRTGWRSDTLAHCRRKDTVSTTSNVTEMMFASSAPPDSETTLEICSGLSGAPSTRLL